VADVAGLALFEGGLGLLLFAVLAAEEVFVAGSLEAPSEVSDLFFAATTGVLGGLEELKKRPPPNEE
jgi:hypothetical protein